MFNSEDIPIFIQSMADVEPVPMCEGITRRTLSTGEKMMFCLFEWEANAILPEHSHHHEQLGYVLSGKIEFTIGGRTVLLGPGQSYAIPGNVLHSGRSYAATRVLDVFSPIREEYL
jgi:quercetin dioxygenase-like cupin family protein